MALTTDIIEISEHTLLPGITDIAMTSTGGFENALVATYTVPYGIYPSNMYIDDGVLHIKYESHTETIYVAVLLIRNDLQVINHLESNLEGAALSAKQGKVLKDLIDSLTAPDIDELGGVDITEPSQGDVLVYDSVEEVWKNISMPTKISDLDDVTISSISNGQILAWNNTSQKFENVNQSGVINYSLTEQDTGRLWIDGSHIYQKTVEFGALPANTTKYVDHGITNLNFILDYSAMAKRPSPFTIIPIPSIHWETLGNSEEISFSDTQIMIRNHNSNASQWSICYITLFYTKSS